MPIEYTNPLAAITDGLKQALLEREEQKRRAEADQMARDREARLRAHDAAQLEVARANAASLEEQRRSTAEARATQRAATVSKQMTPGVVVDDPTYKVLDEGGLGSTVDNSGKSVTATLQDVDAAGRPIAGAPVDTQAVGPRVFEGTQDQQEEARKVAVLQRMYDAATDPDQKLALGFALAGKTTPAELIKDNTPPGVYWASPDKKLMLKRNPTSNEFEQFTGDIPKGATILQAPQPPSNVTISQFSPDAIRAYTALVQAGAVQPTITRANAPLMNRVLTGITQQGDDAITDLTGAKAGYAADSASLTQTTKQLDAIQAYEGLAHRNIETLKTTLPKLVSTGLPILDKPLRQLMLLTGSPDVAKFQTALRPVQAEVARILNGSSNLTGVVSVHAQQEVENLLRGDYNIEQFMAALDILDRDMKARTKELGAKKTEIQGRLRRAPTGGGPAVVAPGPKQPAAPAAPAAANDPLGIL